MEVVGGGRERADKTLPYSHLCNFPSDDLMMGGLGKLMIQWSNSRNEECGETIIRGFSRQIWSQTIAGSHFKYSVDERTAAI